MNNNILIAQFMGIEITERNGEAAVYLSEKSIHPEYFRCTHHDTYDEDWNMLMPVIEKISHIKIWEYPDGTFDICYPRTFGMLNSETGQPMFRFNGYTLHEAETLIQAAYEAVVEVIEHENSLKQP